ncbi:MAG: hypothetical protein K9J27_00915 [Bacteroidales bacterium]|nr:hypothetical protein [Bacteroidales bacterium]MCF8332524.1 hypothetical protein [Bacteroidales bacterium]
MEPTIFWHVGLGRTATTFMQSQVFPKLKGVYYISKKNFKNADEIINQTHHNKYLLSHEFNRDLNEVLRNFSRKYPDARIIIVLRKHEEWIASHYRRVVKNGSPCLFKEYFDADNNKGTWKIDDLYYYPKLKCIEKNFNHKPLVLFHHDLKERPEYFLNQILKYLGISQYDPISFKARHTSYKDKELKFRRWVTRHTFLKEREYRARHLRGGMIRFMNKTYRYVVLYLARLIPDALLSDEPLIPQEELDKIKAMYKNDWERCQQYARENNP